MMQLPQVLIFTTSYTTYFKVQMLTNLKLTKAPKTLNILDSQAENILGNNLNINQVN